MLIAGLITFGVNPNGVKKKFFDSLLSKYPEKNLETYEIENLVVACNNFPLIHFHNTVIVGRMISKTNSLPVKGDDLEHFHIETNAQSYWGDYIALTKNAGVNLQIYVSTSGQIPIFYYSDDTSFIFSNQIHIIKDLVSETTEFNRNYLAKFLLNGNFSSIETPFNGIDEINPGCLLTLSEGSLVVKKTWHPADYLKTESSLDYSQSAPDILFNTLNAWLEPYTTLCLDFSGGLDSTALAFTLDRMIKNSPDKKLIGINAFHPLVNSSNEIKYAQATAAQIDMDIVGFNYENCLPFTPIDSKKWNRNLNKPSILLFHEKYEQEIGALAACYDSPISISGHGGDSLFMCPPTLSSIADYFIERGFAGIKTKIMDLCVRSRLPIYQVLKQGVVEWLKYRFRVENSQLSSQYYRAQWINKSLIDSCETEVTHRIDNSQNCLPGKREHIISLLDTIANTNVNLRSDIYSTFFPFLQQPLLEMGLSMPTYLSLQEGHDRFLFRKGVSRYYQTQSVWRKGKGETSGIAQLGVIANFKHISDLCLDGYMARNHHIDRNLLLNHLRLIECGHVTICPTSNLFVLPGKIYLLLELIKLF